MSARYRYRPEFVEVDAAAAPHPDGGHIWTVRDRISCQMQVLTDAAFHERFEAIPEPGEGPAAE